MSKELEWEGPKKDAIVKQETILVDKLMESELPMEWGVSDAGKSALKLALGMRSSKHGLYASIPMVCRADSCPYHEVCPLLQMDMAPEGERCPLEIAQILKQFENYSEEFGLDQDNVVDMGLVKDLIDIEIQIGRAEKKLAIDGEFTQDYVVSVTEEGEAITNPNIHTAAIYKEKLWKKKHDILQLMNSTRKDKAGDKLTVTLDPSTYAARLMAQSEEMTRKIIDVVEEDDS